MDGRITGASDVQQKFVRYRGTAMLQLITPGVWQSTLASIVSYDGYISVECVHCCRHRRRRSDTSNVGRCLKKCQSTAGRLVIIDGRYTTTIWVSTSLVRAMRVSTYFLRTCDASEYLPLQYARCGVSTYLSSTRDVE